MFLPNKIEIVIALVLCYTNNFAQPNPAWSEGLRSEYLKLKDPLEYNKHIRPILVDKCFVCHGNDKGTRAAGLRLDIAEQAYGPLPNNPGHVAITPGNREKSEVYHRILSDDQNFIMPDPTSHLVLSDREKAILIKWIDEGATYQPHWSYLPVAKFEMPDIKNKIGAITPIDYFIRKSLESTQLTTGKEASKDLLLRRLSLDLTGLPPTIQELDHFLKDSSANAYENQVDRLLRSSHYGEKMTVDWLDLARYADSHGYTVDRLRDMSPYRDWVIKAFNTNLPYNQFVQHQLAGDLMLNPSKEMVIATAFNRNHPMNMEGGIIEEEFQTEYAIDRTNTFGTVFMGLSLGCARCHDHKFDPWSQKNYYELFSFFNNIKEAGQIAWNDAMPTPTLLLPNDEQEKILAFINQSIQEQEKVLADRITNSTSAFKSWLATGQYKKLTNERIPMIGLQGLYDFEDALGNQMSPAGHGKIRREVDTISYNPNFDKHGQGRALRLDGDEYLDCRNQGIFSKSDPFTIGIWLKIPLAFREGVIFHKSMAERLYNFRGYQLYYKKGKFEINMAHTGPSNAITRISTSPIPKDQWLHMAMTYDGSSKAKGFRLFMDGAEMQMETTMDQLYKDILFQVPDEPALQVGGWWRGLGFKDGLVDDITVYNRCLTNRELSILADQSDWKSISTKSVQDLSTADLQVLKEYFDGVVDSIAIDYRKELVRLRSGFADTTEQIQEIMVMQEMPNPAKAHVLIRGNYDELGEEVDPGTPHALSSYPEEYPKNRVGLAQWLTNGQHPLTARVAVNRLWQMFFGQGLVKTSEDFGNQGMMPSHPELLDWLAYEFVQSGWDIKKMNKLIVLSACYRQASNNHPEDRDLDPENIFLSRGPSQRLSAEMIRDQVLLASGLLNPTIGGKSMMPYQPQGLWEINNTHYKPDTTSVIYKRSLYIVLKRSVPNPTMTIFDAQDRSNCLARRLLTNTPLQALVTLNDPTFLEAAKMLGASMTLQKDVSQAIVEVYRKLTGQIPEPYALDLLLQQQKMELEHFKQNPMSVRGLLDQGLSKIDPSLDPVVVAANSIVASTIMNSMASITKR